MWPFDPWPRAAETVHREPVMRDQATIVRVEVVVLPAQFIVLAFELREAPRVRHRGRRPE